MPVRAFPLRLGAIFGVLLAVTLAGCQESNVPKQLKPVPAALSERMRNTNMSETGPVFIRLFKESSELEVWKQKRDGQYALLKTYNICKWSGVLGPKIKEGDRQAPEGFYTVTPAQMNPKSSYYLSFNIGFPNAFDRAHGRTGTHLMVHGACSSSGCYSMTDEDAGELFALARDAFRGGQRAFQIQAFPFRMTPENMAKHRDSEHFAFWQMLKTGSDHFELTRTPPKVDVCGKKYVFDADAGSRKFTAEAACPPYTVAENLKVALASKQAEDDVKFKAAIDRLVSDAAKAEQDKVAAEEKRVAAEKRAADKAAAKEVRSEEIQKKLGVFGRLFNRNKGDGASPQTASTTPESREPESREPESAAVFAPASTPIPPKKPSTSAASVTSPAASPVNPPAPKPQAAAPAVPAPQPAPIAETATKPTIAPAMTTPEIPEVGRFVKKEFNWPES